LDYKAKKNSDHTGHRHNLRFCKTALQVVFYRQNGLQNRFTENLKSANVKRLCKSFFIGKTVCKTVLQKI